MLLIVYGCYQFLDLQANLNLVCYGVEWHRGSCSNPNKCVANSDIKDTRNNRYGVKPLRCDCENKNSTFFRTRGQKRHVCKCEYNC